jgi:hypothetical protein
MLFIAKELVEVARLLNASGKVELFDDRYRRGLSGEFHSLKSEAISEVQRKFAKKIETELKRKFVGWSVQHGGGPSIVKDVRVSVPPKSNDSDAFGVVTFVLESGAKVEQFWDNERVRLEER